MAKIAARSLPDDDYMHEFSWQQRTAAVAGRRPAAAVDAVSAVDVLPAGDGGTDLRG